jgi:hypothetical protein
MAKLIRVDDSTYKELRVRSLERYNGFNHRASFARSSVVRAEKGDYCQVIGGSRVLAGSADIRLEPPREEIITEATMVIRKVRNHIQRDNCLCCKEAIGIEA